MPALSRRAYAKTRNISEAAVRKHIASGALAEAVRADGLLDSDVADAALRGALTRPKATKAPPVLQLARSRHGRATAARLTDEVAELRRNCVDPEDWLPMTAHLYGYIASTTRSSLADLAAQTAGRPAAEVQMAVRNAINAALTVLHEGIPAQEHVYAAGIPETQTTEVDIEALTPVQLQAHVLDLKSEIAERERELARGTFRWLDDLIMEGEEKMGIWKSQLLAMPGRTAQLLEAASLPEATALIDRELDLALAPLG